MPFIRAALLLVLVLFSVVAGLPIRWLCRRLALPTGWIGRGFCRGALLLLGIRLRVDGGDMRPPRLLVANHVSWLDVLALRSVEPLSFLAKREVAAWPLIGRFARGEGAIFIDRRRRRQIIAANRQMAERMRTGGTMVLFPEGTTHDGLRRGRFLTSHLACLRHCHDPDPHATRCAAQPVAIAYSHPVAAWVGDATLLPHLWAVLRQPGITCRLTYGTPIAVEAGFDRKRLGAELARAVDSLLQPESAASAAGTDAILPTRPPSAAGIAQALSGRRRLSASAPAMEKLARSPNRLEHYSRAPRS